MDDSRNFTFDEIVVGHSETLTRQLCVTEIEALAPAAGAIDPAHIEGAPTKDGPTAPGAAAAALVSNLLLRRFPGPGSAIVETQLRYSGMMGVGDKLTITVSARGKHADGHRVEFDCRCVNQHDATLVEGTARHSAAEVDRLFERGDAANCAASQRRLCAPPSSLRSASPDPLRRRSSVRSRLAPRRSRSREAKNDRAGVGRPRKEDSRRGFDRKPRSDAL
jgi:acyl dehydratase